ncbi:hypothetical protein V1511DRAFT_511056 [Dipodascopsis uninucleata]
MGVCLSCTRREEDHLFPSERQALLSEYGPTTMSLSDDVLPESDDSARREEAMARIVAMTEENLIDIFAVGAPDRRVNGQSAVDYQALLRSMKILEFEDIEPKILPSESLTKAEIALLRELGKVSKAYVDRIYTVKSVGALIVKLEE